MIDFKMKYQATVFLNARDMVPSAENITALVEAFHDRGLIPSTLQEIGTGGPPFTIRPRLSTASNEWVINIPSDRIDIEKNPTDSKGSNLGDIRSFCSDATDYFGRILRRFNKRANRLAVITTFLLNEMENSVLSSIYTRLFRPPSFYSENSPFEWDWRSASKLPFHVGTLEEKLNVITIIKRVRGELGFPDRVVPIDRIQVSLDINTGPESGEYRFELSHITDYYDHVIDLHDSLIGEVLEFINE